MAPQTFSLPRQIGQIAIQAGKHRAGNMPGLEVALALIGISQLKAAIDDQHIIGRERGELARLDQGGLQGHACPILCSRFSNIAAVAPQIRWPPCRNSTIGRCFPRKSMV
jgi:hypothetical protein